MSSPEEFVERFTAAWSSRDARELVDLLHEDVELRQPLLPPIHGREAAERSLERVIDAIPGLHIDVESWAAHGDTVFIEFTLVGDDVRLPMVDRIELRDGRVALRLNYQDLRAVYAQVARKPSLVRRLSATGASLRSPNPAAGLPAPLSATGPDVTFTEAVRTIGLPGIPAQRVAITRPRAGARPARHYLCTPLAMGLPSRRIYPEKELVA